MLPAAFICEAPAIVDGDTIRCEGRGRIRLSGIDAPELPGHCRKGRLCAPGDPEAARLSLEWALRYGPWRVMPVTTDRFGRIVGMVHAGKYDLSCWQLQYRHAVYVEKWDTKRAVARLCPQFARR